MNDIEKNLHKLLEDFEDIEEVKESEEETEDIEKILNDEFFLALISNIKID